MKVNKKYYKDVAKLFPIYSKKEKSFLSDLKKQIDEYDNVSYSDLENEFGTPIDIVKAYYDTVDSKYLLNRINIKRAVVIICLTILVVGTSYFGYRTYSLNKAINDFKTSIPTEIEETVEVVE